MDKLRMRGKITGNFKINGLSLSSDAATYLTQILIPIAEPTQSAWLDRIVDKVLKNAQDTTLISKALVESAVNECGKGHNDEGSETLTFIDAYSVPKLNYDVERKKFFQEPTPSAILCDAVEKPSIFRRRYSLLLQRTMHHELFSPSIHGADFKADKKKFNLKTIEFLSGTTNKIEDIVVLGMITQLKEGKYYLEDLTGSVQLDLTSTTFHTGLYTENCIVLVEGSYDEGILHVNAIGLPPSEEAEHTRAYYRATNFFGGPDSVNKTRMEVLEKEKEDRAIVFLSDVHIDLPIVRDKLRILFEGYSELPPIMIIFMGNFLANPRGTQSALLLRDSFKHLADIIVEYPSLMRETKFVFVSGPLDPGFINILPRPPFADVIIDSFKEKVPSSIFTSNPCRIKYCTKEIIILREDILTKMSRNSIYYPTNGNIPTHFVKTLIGQSHLCPLPLHICPIYWSYDHALSIYPLPDLVIIGDKADPFTVTHDKATFTNPGSFVKTDFSFKSYTPYTNIVEDCQLPSETE